MSVPYTMSEVAVGMLTALFVIHATGRIWAGLLAAVLVWAYGEWREWRGRKLGNEEQQNTMNNYERSVKL